MNRICDKCGKQRPVFQYPCRNLYCHVCVAGETWAKLRYLKFLVKNDLSQVQNQSSNLTCLNKCVDCEFSVSIDSILESVESLDWNSLDKEEFRSLSDLGKTFFSGFKTIFSKCLICSKFSSAIDCYPLVCKTCIKTLVSQTTDQDLFDIIYSSNSPGIVNNHGVVNSEMAQEIHLIAYKEFSSTIYMCEPGRNDEGKIGNLVFRIKNLHQDDLFILARFTPMIDVSRDVIWIKNQDDIEVLCVLIAKQADY